MRGNSALRPASSKGAPLRSWMSAGCTRALSKLPSVSTRMWRLRPEIFLAAVVAARTAGLGGADGLAVDDGCRGLCLAADDEAVLLTQRRVDPLPGAVPTPLGIVVEHCCPGRKVVRQGAPLTSSAEQVEHGLDDAAQCEGLWMSRLLSWAKQRCKDRPFRVAQI